MQLIEIILIHSCLLQSKFLQNVLILRHPNIFLLSLLSLLFRQARGDAPGFRLESSIQEALFWK